MDAQAQELENDVYEPPVVNSWRLPPSREQTRYAKDLCLSELEFPQRAIERFPAMSRYEMSALIRSLKIMRAQRLRAQPRDRHWRLVL